MRIAGITIPDDKRLEYALTGLYGVGITRAKKILADAKVPLGIRGAELTPEQENAIRDEVAKYRTEGDLKREISNNIKRLKDIQSYRGSRHAKRLPAHGQRTKTNARTLKGVRKTMGSGKKKVEKK